MIKPKIWIVLISSLVTLPFMLAVFCAAAAAQNQPRSETASGAAAGVQKSSAISAFAAPDSELGPGDLIEVRVFGVPEFTQEMRISNGGKVAMPLIGSIQAAGLTPAELEQRIAEALRSGGYMNDPQVSIAAKEMHTASVSVIGEVVKPGAYPVFGSCRLIDMISTAGGLSPRGGQVVVITRHEGAEGQTRVNIAHDAGRNFILYPGDSVEVTRAGVVYVLGEVNHAAGLVMDNDNKMTVIQALSMAGGTTQNAGLKGTRIIRTDEKGIQEIPIPMKLMMQAKAPDVELQPGDVIFVPGNRGAAVWKGVTSVLQTATMATIIARQ